MILLFDIGNTHTHVGLADAGRVRRHTDIPTREWDSGSAEARVKRFVGLAKLEGVSVCSVVPRCTPKVVAATRRNWNILAHVLSSATLRGVGIRYPKPETIGPDRLSNALAVRLLYGTPSLVVDFGTAVTFDVVSRAGDYIGGVIAPGLAAMTDYLHEKTALLPKIRIRDVKASVGKNTEQAMLIGAVHGYRGLVKELIAELKRDLGVQSLPVVATGGYAALMARGVPEITAVNSMLTLEGLRLAWLLREEPSTGRSRGAGTRRRLPKLRSHSS